MESKLNKKQLINIVAVILVIVGLFIILKNKVNISNNPIENIEEQPINAENSQQNEDSDIKTSIMAEENFNQSMEKAQEYFSSKQYNLAIKSYEEALSYKNSDLPYSGMFSVYIATANFKKAEESINKAISINSVNTDYWKWKLTLLDEKTNTNFSELKKIYEEGLAKSHPTSRVNLVIHFAKIAEDNGQKQEAIELWEKAIELYPQNKNVFQAEIDRLSK